MDEVIVEDVAPVMVTVSTPGVVAIPGTLDRVKVPSVLVNVAVIGFVIDTEPGVTGFKTQVNITDAPETIGVESTTVVLGCGQVIVVVAAVVPVVGH